MKRVPRIGVVLRIHCRNHELRASCRRGYLIVDVTKLLRIAFDGVMCCTMYSPTVGVRTGACVGQMGEELVGW